MNEFSFNLIKSFIFIYLFIYSIFLHYLSGFHKFIDKTIEYELVIPCSLRDAKFFFKHKKYYDKYINYSNLVLIGESNISKLITNETSISFIHEDFLVPKKKN